MIGLPFPCNSDPAKLLVYMPSPLESYELAGTMASVQSYPSGNSLHPLENVKYRGRELCSLVADLASSAGHAFVDIREAFREESLQTFLHDPPRDSKHPNRKGYTVLGHVVANALSAPQLDHGACSDNITRQLPPPPS